MTEGALHSSGVPVCRQLADLVGKICVGHLAIGQQQGMRRFADQDERLVDVAPEGAGHIAHAFQKRPLGAVQRFLHHGALSQGVVWIAAGRSSAWQHPIFSPVSSLRQMSGIGGDAGIPDGLECLQT